MRLGSKTCSHDGASYFRFSPCVRSRISSRRGSGARSARFATIDRDAKIEFESIKMKGVHEATPTSPIFAVGKITYAESPDDASWLSYTKPTYFYEYAPAFLRDGEYCISA
jgi:hypothetical protein